MTFNERKEEKKRKKNTTLRETRTPALSDSTLGSRGGEG